MIAMRIYQVIISYEVMSELEAMVKYIASIYRPESGHNYYFAVTDLKKISASFQTV